MEKYWQLESNLIFELILLITAIPKQFFQNNAIWTMENASNRIFFSIKSSLMEEGTTSIQHIQETPPQSTAYFTVSILNYHFRMLSMQFHQNTLMLYYCCFFWVGFAMASAILIMTHSLQLQPFPFFVTLAGALIPLTAFSIHQRSAFGASLVVSSVLLNCIMVILAVLFSLEIPYSGVAFCLYVMAQTISSLFNKENLGKVLLKSLVMVQFLILCLKIDGIIGNQALFGLAIILIFLLVTAMCVFCYALLVSWCFHEEYHEIKRAGLIYLSLNLLSVACAIAIPLWTVFVNDSYHLPTKAALLCASITSLFAFFQRTKIILYLCKTLEAAGKKEPSFRLESKDPLGMAHLFRVSPNWFVEKPQADNCESGLEVQECVACMASKAEAVWQPCGHCSLCGQCMHQMLQTGLISCPLCKALPSSVVRVRGRSELNQTVLGINQYQIIECLMVV